MQADYIHYHNNHILLVRIDEGAEEITVQCKGEVETFDTAGVLGRHGGHVPLWYFLRSTPLTELSREIQALAKSAEGDDQLATLHALSTKILEIRSAMISATPTPQPPPTRHSPRAMAYARTMRTSSSLRRVCSAFPHDMSAAI